MPHKNLLQTVISAGNIAGILDVVDSDGNKWYQVDYLGQEQVFDGIKNTNTNDPNNTYLDTDAPYLLQTKQVQNRFATRFLSSTQLQLQFGAGSFQLNNRRHSTKPI